MCTTVPTRFTAPGRCASSREPDAAPVAPPARQRRRIRCCPISTRTACGRCPRSPPSYLSTLPAETVKTRFATRGLPLPAWFVIAVGALFTLLWLSEIGLDLLAGGPSRSAAAWDVPTNPVHVLDLALFLPAVVTSGVLLLRRHPFGYATVVGQLVWLALTSLPILVTPFVAASRGHEPGWAVMLPRARRIAGRAEPDPGNGVRPRRRTT